MLRSNEIACDTFPTSSHADFHLVYRKQNGRRKGRKEEKSYPRKNLLHRHKELPGDEQIMLVDRKKISYLQIIEIRK